MTGYRKFAIKYSQTSVKGAPSENRKAGLVKFLLNNNKHLLWYELCVGANEKARVLERTGLTCESFGS